jgi:hypothetical protein
MYATKIKMCAGCHNSTKCEDIDSIYITGADKEGFYPKSNVHDAVKQNPGSIQVNISPYPNLVPAVSSKGEKYVRSEANDSPNDNLLKLPRV